MSRGKKLTILAAAAVVVGWMIMSWLSLAPRQMAFGVILIIGLCLLASLRQEKNRPASPPAEASVNALLKGDFLSPEGAREWLDRFLVEQQDKK